MTGLTWWTPYVQYKCTTIYLRMFQVSVHSSLGKKVGRMKMISRVCHLEYNKEMRGVMTKGKE